jgi:glycosyltransferase involved in cell wall biosynthesis
VTPQVSFIVPSFQQGRFIGRCLDSIQAQGLPRDSFEVLVFDAGSTDETVEVLRDHPLGVEWVSEPDRGQAHAVNKGFARARGEVVAWLNSDDFYHEGALRRVLDYFGAHPDAEVVYGLADHVDESGRVVADYDVEPFDRERLAHFCFVCQPALFFRRRLVERVGYLDESMHIALDYDYWLRLSAVTDFHFIPAKLAVNRRYGSNKTVSQPLQNRQECLLISRRHRGGWSPDWTRSLAGYLSRRFFHAHGFKDPNLVWCGKWLVYGWLRVRQAAGRFEP